MYSNMASDSTSFLPIALPAIINGARVPTALRGDRIEIYVPYLAGQATGAVLQVSGVLYRREPASKQQASKEFSDKIVFHEKHLVPEGGFEFPRWEENEKITISVREPETINQAALDKQEHDANPQSAPPPPLFIEVQ